MSSPDGEAKNSTSRLSLSSGDGDWAGSNFSPASSKPTFAGNSKDEIEEVTDKNEDEDNEEEDNDDDDDEEGFQHPLALQMKAALEQASKKAPTGASGKQLAGFTDDEKAKKALHCAQGSLPGGEKRMPTIFDLAKGGHLLGIQMTAEMMGDEALHERDDGGYTLAHWVCLQGHLEVLRYLAQRGAPLDLAAENQQAVRPIHWACGKGHIQCVDFLLQNGADLDGIDSKHCTPLITACQNGQTALAVYLMGRGARIQCQDVEGDTALHWAAFKGYSELMRLLIYSGLNPRQTDSFGQTPLHLSSINGNLTAVKELCEIDDVEIDLKDKNGKTPLILAKGRKHTDIVNYLSSLERKHQTWVPKVDLNVILFGPPGNTKAALIFLLANIIFLGYPLYIFKILPTTFYDLEVLHILFLTANILMWMTLFKAGMTEPGFLPIDIPEYHETIKQIASIEWQKRMGADNPLTRLCHTCRTVRPLRAKHCRLCQRCVREFDHHCPYIYNCVGYRNRHWFAAFVTLISFLGLSGCYMLYYYYTTIGWDWLLALAGLEMFGFTLMTVCLNLCVQVQAVMNITTNERINMKRYEYLKDGSGRFYNRFDRGPLRNVLEFYHFYPAQSEQKKSPFFV